MATQGSTPALDAPDLCPSVLLLGDEIRLRERSGRETVGVFDYYWTPSESDSGDLEVDIKNGSGLFGFLVSDIDSIVRVKPGKGAGGPMAVYRYARGEG